MHPEPEIVQAELGEVVAVNGVGIKVVLLQPATELPALLVFSPGVTGPRRMPDAMTDAATFRMISEPNVFIRAAP